MVPHELPPVVISVSAFFVARDDDELFELVVQCQQVQRGTGRSEHASVLARMQLAMRACCHEETYRATFVFALHPPFWRYELKLPLLLFMSADKTFSTVSVCAIRNFAAAQSRLPIRFVRFEFWK